MNSVTMQADKQYQQCATTLCCYLKNQFYDFLLFCFSFSWHEALASHMDFMVNITCCFGGIQVEIPAAWTGIWAEVGLSCKRRSVACNTDFRPKPSHELLLGVPCSLPRLTNPWGLWWPPGWKPVQRRKSKSKNRSLTLNICRELNFYKKRFYYLCAHIIMIMYRRQLCEKNIYKITKHSQNASTQKFK